MTQETEFCGRPGTGECSCLKFGSDPTNCRRRDEWRAEQGTLRIKKITLVLPYPVSANAYWGTRVVKPKGKPAMAMTYVTHEARSYKAQVLTLARAAGIQAPITGRVQLEIWLYPNRPLDWQARQRKLGVNWDDGVRSIDLDNANKVLLDSIKDIVIEDDKWVRRISSQRMEPDEKGARVLLRVTAIETPQPQSDLLENAS
jgi:crossover junction endodeoxyribonuclease RusA